VSTRLLESTVKFAIKHLRSVVTMRITINTFILERSRSSLYVRAFGRAAFVKREPEGCHPTSPWFDRWTSLGENFIRVGKVSIIYTPKDYLARRAIETTTATA
jgi:hypothetical protein